MKRPLLISVAFALSAFSLILLFSLVFTLTHRMGDIGFVDELGLEATLGILSEPPGQAFVLVSVALSICWVFNFVKAFAKLKWRGLWLLASLPIALFWPVPYPYLMLVCTFGFNGCAV